MISGGADDRFMAEALRLAERGRFRVEPNPVVGALVVRDGVVVGRGFHAVYGGAHAEVAALSEAGDGARGGTLFVTLEPCAHRGKTPPCAEAVLRAGVRRVVCAAADPNPVTAGRGPALLRSAGVEVETGVREEEAKALNPWFEAHLAGDLPWTIAKWAMSLDGKIADHRGAPGPISGPEARRLVHEVRGAVDAVVVGIGTALADDPLLTARSVERRREAARVVLDSRLRLAPDSRLAATAREVPTWVATGEGAPAEAERRLVEAGVRVLRFAGCAGRLPLAAVFRRLRAEGIARLLLEGGGEVHASALEEGLVRQVMVFVAPMLLGGRTAPMPVSGRGFREIADPARLARAEVRRVGPDVLIEGYTDPDGPSAGDHAG